MSRPFPIVEYAHKINKNTAEFTVNDLVAFMKWWTKQPVRKDILSMRNEYKKTVGNKVNQNNIDDGDAEEAMEEQQENEVVAELGLTRLDVEALKWALGIVIEEYDMSESAYGKPLLDLKESLDGV